MNVREVRSEVILRQDLQSILRAMDAANAELAARLPSEEVAAYRAGFSAALQAVATAFHATLTPHGDAVSSSIYTIEIPQRRVRGVDQASAPMLTQGSASD